MPDIEVPSVRNALRQAITRAMKQRDREATAAYRVALAAIDNAEAVPTGTGDRAGAIEFSAVGVGRTDAPRRMLSEQDMIEIVRREVHTLRATAESLTQRNPDAARRRLYDATLLRSLLDGLSSPGSAGAIPVDRVLAGQPPVFDVGTNLDQIRAGRRLVVLDDDPTGTQSIADLPVLTSWSVADLRWALAQPTAAFFVLTNTRSLSEGHAVERNEQIVRALDEAAKSEGVPYVIASRGDSTLRGYYPLETDVLARELAQMGTVVDGVVICPAYIEPGRITVDSVHWMRTDDGMIPVAHSEFAKDASFGYHHSDLRDWVEEKTAGRISRDDVATITLTDIRRGGPDRVQEVLTALTDGYPVVVDAADDADLEVVALALIRAEAAGKNLLYRTGPSFVRARSGQRATPAIDGDRLVEILGRKRAGDVDDARPAVANGLIVVGSHVGLTTRQLDRLRAAGNIIELELHVPTLLDAKTHDGHLADVAAQAAELLQHNNSGNDIVIRTSRTLITGTDAVDSLAIARVVSAGLVGTVRELLTLIRPAFVLAKGGITSSDTATDGLGIRRAWSRGTMLPGIVSLWEPVAGPAEGIPYIVFAGNVGDDEALAAVVATLRSAAPTTD